MDLRHIKLLVLFLCSGYLAAEEIIVEIPDGKIKGQTVTNVITNNTFFTFQGIPYAAPPINELRFQAPQPVEPWDDILDATYEKSICHQLSGYTPNQNEDCLFINVFTPQNPLNASTSLPVLFHFYGGGFITGSSDQRNVGPQHLIEHDIIFVTSNYRIGPFGFFSTGDSAIPGNAGLKDQNFALRWVQKNIKYFGGDPEKVTIFGQSAGGASVTYHILSPKSKGLFRAAIADSGSALCPWAYQRNQVEITYQTAAYINSGANVTEKNSTELLEYLLDLPAVAISAAAGLYASRMESAEYIQIQQGYFYAPVVEHEHEGAFISKPQYEILESGEINKVPLIIGFTSEEAMFMTANQSDLLNTAQVFDKNHKLLVPRDLHLTDEDTINEAAEEIKALYSDVDFEEDPLRLVRYSSDQSFTRALVKYAEIQSQLTDVHFYRFAYSGPLGGIVQEPVEGFSETVRHGEELTYIFVRNWENQNTTDLSKFPESDVLVLRRLTTLYTNFVKTLNPTPERDELLQNVIWPRVNPVYFPYLDIGSSFQVKLHPRNDTFGAWETIYEEYGEEPYDTY